MGDNSNIVYAIAAVVLMGALITGTQSSAAPSVNAAGIFPDSGPVSKTQARAFASQTDAREFGGWFSRSGRSIDYVLAIWKWESDFNLKPRNLADSGGGAWGIGHVLASTATDYGVYSPSRLLNPNIGALVSMQHLKSIWGDLERRLGQPPTIKQWIMAYNAGARGVAQGRTAAEPYYAAIMAARSNL